MISKTQLYVSKDESQKIFFIELDENISTHRHDMKEISIILEGRIELNSKDGRKKEYKANDIFTIEPFVEHYLICKEKTKGVVIYTD